MQMPQRMIQILGVAMCIVAGCSKGPSAGQVSSTSRSPDGKHLAELVEWQSGNFAVADRHFAIRIKSLTTNNPQAETIFSSPDEGELAERLLWSDDSRYLLLVGRAGGLGVGPEAVTDTGDVLYLLYDLQMRELKCNSTQLNTPLKPFGFRELAGINFRERFSPRK